MKRSEVFWTVLRSVALLLAIVTCTLWILQRAAPATAASLWSTVGNTLRDRATSWAQSRLDAGSESLARGDADQGVELLASLVKDLGPRGRDVAPEDRLANPLRAAHTLLQDHWRSRGELARAQRHAEARQVLDPRNIALQLQQAQLRFAIGNRDTGDAADSMTDQSIAQLEALHRKLPEAEEVTAAALAAARRVGDLAWTWRVIERALHAPQPGLWELHYRTPYCLHQGFNVVQHDLLIANVGDDGTLLSTMRLPPGVTAVRLHPPIHRSMRLHDALLERLQIASDGGSRAQVLETHFAHTPHASLFGLGVEGSALVADPSAASHITWEFAPVDPGSWSLAHEVESLAKSPLAGPMFRFRAIFEPRLSPAVAQHMIEAGVALEAWLRESADEDGSDRAAVVAAVRIRAHLERDPWTVRQSPNESASASGSPQPPATPCTPRIVAGGGSRAIDAFRPWTQTPNAKKEIPSVRFALRIPRAPGAKMLTIDWPNHEQAAWRIGGWLPRPSANGAGARTPTQHSDAKFLVPQIVASEQITIRDGVLLVTGPHPTVTLAWPERSTTDAAADAPLLELRGSACSKAALQPR